MVPDVRAGRKEERDLGEEKEVVRVEAPAPEPREPRYVVREPRRMAVKNMMAGGCEEVGEAKDDPEENEDSSEVDDERCRFERGECETLRSFQGYA
ncbi:tripeptidyl peptidase [Pseudozyma hubeiensis SY62]|uniref:Tripeptidyl peptidase n=1 Tax=Pseudozyma hubeiensis (strain SY62) TaxID=1305764 RepID=R9P4U2_PSEHS|nr:tripeptidyl peptidase [Pseudozyma hubeiensis SY62]GAC96356.1 tripeptidyl peptidase [Pseudozyma hubeiensis SY62]